jgi:hypothetical protein
MPFEITCPKGHRLQISDAHFGQRIQCPACNEWFVVPDASQPQSPAPPSKLGGKMPSNPLSNLGRLSLLTGRPMVAVGLLLVLLCKGCESVGRRGVESAEANLEKAKTQFQDEKNSKLNPIRRELGLPTQDETAIGDHGIATRPALTGHSADEAAKPDEKEKLAKRLDELTKSYNKDENAKQDGEWHDLRNVAREANSGYKINGYWRELFFVFGGIVLSLGLLVVSWGAEGAERWLTLVMLAIITFSMFIPGPGWVSPFVR